MQIITVLLLSLFVVLTGGKLTGMVEYSWLWATSPLWICAALYLCSFIAFKAFGIEHYGRRDA